MMNSDKSENAGNAWAIYLSTPWISLDVPTGLCTMLFPSGSSID